jgi:hypothetical protein
MSADLLFLLIIGNFVGEYITQSGSLHLLKSYLSTKCLIHSSIYTVVVLLFIAIDFPRSHNMVFQLPIFALITLSTHFLIDRLDPVDKWLHLLGSKSHEHTMSRVHDSTSKLYSMYESAYTAIFQTIGNNVLYLLIMYLSLRIVIENF